MDTNKLSALCDKIEKIDSLDQDEQEYLSFLLLTDIHWLSQKKNKKYHHVIQEILRQIRKEEVDGQLSAPVRAA